MSERKLPDISEEDKKVIAGVETDLKELYDEEAAFMESLRTKKKKLNEKHREAIRVAHKNRMDKINADPELLKLHQELSQAVGV